MRFHLLFIFVVKLRQSDKKVTEENNKKSRKRKSATPQPKVMYLIHCRKFILCRHEVCLACYSPDRNSRGA